MSALTDAHITTLARLRRIATTAVGTIWTGLPAHNRENLDEWLSTVVPVVHAAQRQSAAITNAFLAQAVGRQPLPVDLAAMTGAAVRNGTPPETVYERPFITVWSALKDGRELPDALKQGLDRATSAAEMDVQLAMRETLRQVGDADRLILGYQRVPDPGACEFCRVAATQRYRTSDLFPLHNRCGCGVDVIRGTQRPDFSGRYDRDIVTDDGVHAAVRDHGELGPVLVDGRQKFTTFADIAA